MSDYTLPPVPDHPEPRHMRWSELEQKAIADYGLICSYKAREPLLARIAELEAENDSLAHQLNSSNERNGRLRAELAQVSGYCETLTQRCIDETAESGQLRAEVEALRECWTCLRSLSRHVERMREAGLVQCDDTGPEDWARTLLSRPARPWVNPLAAEVEALRDCLAECLDDLSSEINARALGELPRRIERDLAPVRRAAALLAQPAGSWVNPLAAEVEALRADADRYRWLKENNESWSWNPTPYNQELVTGFSAFSTGYLGYAFEDAIDAACRNKL